MKIRLLSTVISGLLCGLTSSASALDGEPYIHDPSTIVECDGKFYTFGTGSGGLISDDGGWTWKSGAVRPGGGVAPDIIKIGDRYLVSYATGGSGGEHSFRVITMWNKTLDPQSPDFKYTDEKEVIHYNVSNECDAIDPAFLLDPTTGKLWLSYGTYFGYIEIVELDPKTGGRIPGCEPVRVAIDCEATAMMYRDGWYYLLGTHGTCCSGANSTYNIRVGRSKSITGPYLDNMGQDMFTGGGKLVLAANGRCLGPGHFGLTDLGDGVQKFSFHYEADLDRSGRSTLDIRPLLWKDGWPIAGDDFRGGTFEIESQRSGYCLEMGVDSVPFASGRGGGMTGFGGRNAGGPVTPIPDQNVAEISKDWPAKELVVRLGDYMLRPHQKWAITPVSGVGGTLGAPYFKITIEGTERALSTTANAELAVVQAYSGKPEELWKIDQLIDGTYRIMPKSQDNPKEPLVLTAISASTPSLAKFNPTGDESRWTFRKP